MDLKGMILTVVWDSPEGLAPIQIVEALASKFGAQTNTKQVLQITESNPKLFIEVNGRIKSPSGDPTKKASPNVGLKDKVLAVVWDSPDGLAPYQIVEAIARDYGTQTNTKQVLQLIESNPKLFVEVDGRIRSPSR